MGRGANRAEAIAVDHRRLRLQPGSHRSPLDGVCVVELASVLAGEEFSDRPDCVCEVIGAFLRGWNDRAGYADRQRLAPYAKGIVGTRGPREVTRMRRDACLIWAGARLDRGPLRRLAARIGVRLRILVLLGLRPALRMSEGAGDYAARVIFASYGEEAAFSLLDRLLAISSERGVGGSGSAGRRSEAAPLANPVAGTTEERVAAAIRELARDAQVADRHHHRNGGNGHGHSGDVRRRDSGERDEEPVERDYAEGGDPEGDPQAAEHVHVGVG